MAIITCSVCAALYLVAHQFLASQYWKVSFFGSLAIGIAVELILTRDFVRTLILKIF